MITVTVLSSTTKPSLSLFSNSHNKMNGFDAGHQGHDQQLQQEVLQVATATREVDGTQILVYRLKHDPSVPRLEGREVLFVKEPQTSRHRFKLWDRWFRISWSEGTGVTDVRLTFPYSEILDVTLQPNENIVHVEIPETSSSTGAAIDLSHLVFVITVSPH